MTYCNDACETRLQQIDFGTLFDAFVSEKLSSWFEFETCEGNYTQTATTTLCTANSWLKK